MERAELTTFSTRPRPPCYSVCCTAAADAVLIVYRLLCSNSRARTEESKTFQPDLKKVTNQWAKMLTANSIVKSCSSKGHQSTSLSV